jgi:hypothetical protein
MTDAIKQSNCSATVSFCFLLLILKLITGYLGLATNCGWIFNKGQKAQGKMSVV